MREGTREDHMTGAVFDRRGVLMGSSALAAAAFMPRRAHAQAAGLPARGEFVIRGAYVLTMDPAIADLPVGDVHVRDGAIVAVGTNVAAPGAEVIEGRDTICMPGFVDTHWHLWTTALRPLMRLDNPQVGYFPVTSRLGPHMQPQDSYRAVRMGLAEALSAGITTVHNWAHNVRSPAHADAEIAAMRDTGIRGRFGYGTPQGAPNEQPMDLADLARVKRELASDPLLTLGIASRNVGRDPNAMRGNVTIELAKKEWGGARELGLPITLHTSGPSPVKLLDEAGLLGPDVQLVHPLLTTPEERAILKARGVSYSASPTGESQRPAAAGKIQIGEMLEAGVKVSLSTDLTGTYNCDFFVTMRIAYSLHRHRLGTPILTNKRLVQLATIDGARDLGFDSKVGSLTPGKRADLITVRTDAINMRQMGDPYETLVAMAMPTNVDLVVVDGRILRRGGKFTALDYPKVLQEATESAAAIRQRAGWP
jgi:cytosine/adenosine deaminase-related metal-dependent hydrolase